MLPNINFYSGSTLMPGAPKGFKPSSKKEKDE